MVIFYSILEGTKKVEDDDTLKAREEILSHQVGQVALSATPSYTQGVPVAMPAQVGETRSGSVGAQNQPRLSESEKVIVSDLPTARRQSRLLASELEK